MPESAGTPFAHQHRGEVSVTLFNLKPKEIKAPWKPSVRRQAEWWVPVFGLVFVLAFTVWFSSRQGQPQIDFGIEERESIVFHLNVLELDHPDFKKSVALWRDMIGTGKIEVVLDESPATSPLLREANGTLHISKHYFTADLIEQKRALSRLIGLPAAPTEVAKP